MPHGPLPARTGKLGAQIGGKESGLECGDDRIVMSYDCLAFRGRFALRVGLDEMDLGGHPIGHHAEMALPQMEGGDPTVLGGSPLGQMLEAQWFMRG